MKNMNVRVTMNNTNLKKLSKSQILAVKMTGEQMLHELVSESVMPFDTGALQNVATYVETKEAKKGFVSIVHDIIYAARLYFHPEYNFDKTINENARGEWWEDWLRGSKKERPSKLFKEFYRRVTRGIVK